MPPRGLTNPAPKTESALLAARSFYCDLCGKGYSRINEFEAHEGSYDHLHKKRLKEMKQMSRDPLASTKARKAERKANESIINIKLAPSDPSTSTSTTSNNTKSSGKAGGAGFKKGGFKNAFASVDDGDGEVKAEEQEGIEKGGNEVVRGQVGEEEAESEDEEGAYDPRFPTGCWAGCPGRHVDPL